MKNKVIAFALLSIGVCITPTTGKSEGIKIPNEQSALLKDVELSNLLRITMKDGTIRDETIVHFRADATPQFDDDADAWKLRNGTFNLSTLSQDGYKLAINSWSPFTDNLSIKISVDDAGVGTYSLLFTNVDSFDEDVEIKLGDAFLGKTVSITDSLAYQFDVTSDSSSYGSERFRLLINPSPPIEAPAESPAEVLADLPAEVPIEVPVDVPVVAPVEAPFELPPGTLITGMDEFWRSGMNIYPNPTSSAVFISSERGGISHIILTNMVGQVIEERMLVKSDLQQVESFQIHGSAGLYLLTVVTGKGIYTKKVLKH